MLTGGVGCHLSLLRRPRVVVAGGQEQKLPSVIACACASTIQVLYLCMCVVCILVHLGKEEGH